MNQSMLLGFAVLTLLPRFTTALHAWGPHQPITTAALEVLPPEQQELREKAGRSNLRDSMRHNWDNLGEYAMMPDHGITDYAGYWTPDYNLHRKFPEAVSHTMPDVMQAIEPNFRRGLQALKTESLTEAFRRLGPLLHYIQDIGSPPHATPIREQPAHTLMENWDGGGGALNIGDYKPVLLGQTPEEALTGLLRRLEGLVTFSAQRAELLLPLVREHGEENRERYQHLVIESAEESARVTADLLYTIFTIGLRDPEPGSAMLSGQIGYEPSVRYHDGRKGTRLVLLKDDLYKENSSDADSRFHHAATEFSTFTDPDGYYALRNLPPGIYRLFAYRLGAVPMVSDPFELAADETTVVDLQLEPAEPNGNLVYNPEGMLFEIQTDQPDRWWKTDNGWMQAIHIAGTHSQYLGENSAVAAFRVGADWKDPETRIVVQFTGYDARNPWKEFELGVDEVSEKEFSFPWIVDGKNYYIDSENGKERLSRIIVEVRTAGRLSDAAKRIWVVPIYKPREGKL